MFDLPMALSALALLLAAAAFFYRVMGGERAIDVSNTPISRFEYTEFKEWVRRELDYLRSKINSPKD